MTRTISPPFVIAIIMAAQAACAADPTDQHPLEGAWIVVSGQTNGKAEDDMIDTKVIFQGNKLTIQRSATGETDKATFTIDPKASPATIDIKGGDEGTTVPGIYELSGDQLKICFRKGEGDRPAEFDSKPNSHVQLLVLKRNKK